MTGSWVVDPGRPGQSLPQHPALVPTGRPKLASEGTRSNETTIKKPPRFHLGKGKGFKQRAHLPSETLGSLSLT